MADVFKRDILGTLVDALLLRFSRRLILLTSHLRQLLPQIAALAQQPVCGL